MAIYGAAISLTGSSQATRLYRNRAKHGRTYFPTRSAAERALDRAARKAGGGRGFLWPISAGPYLTAADLAPGRELPPYVETIAL